MGKRELIALLNLPSWCLVMVERLFLAVPRGCLQFAIVVFPDNTHLLFFYLSHGIFAFACIDKSPNCQESYLILLKNRRHMAAFVYLICLYLQMDFHIICMASS